MRFCGRDPQCGAFTLRLPGGRAESAPPSTLSAVVHFVLRGALGKASDYCSGEAEPKASSNRRAPAIVPGTEGLLAAAGAAAGDCIV